jgi:hypothetical protein
MRAFLSACLADDLGREHLTFPLAHTDRVEHGGEQLGWLK